MDDGCVRQDGLKQTCCSSPHPIDRILLIHSRPACYCRCKGTRRTPEIFHPFHNLNSQIKEVKVISALLTEPLVKPPL
ncbi:hypothetical protein MHYP_G00005880 [Metynnis hypsauchen]